MSIKRPFRRRALLGAGLALAAGAVIAIRPWQAPPERMDAEAAHRAVLAGALILVDIRTPREWQATGIGEGAIAIDMRRDDFTEELDRATDGDRDRPVALICARGVRSARLAVRLEQAGYTRIIDVPEGMLGSFSGPGWLARGLPVTPA